MQIWSISFRLSVEEYLNKIKHTISYYIINDLKKSDTWKIQLIITINFISSTGDNYKEREMHSKSLKIEIIMKDEANEVAEGLFESLKKRYQNKMEEPMKDNEFVFDYVHLLYYKFHKINPNRGEKATTNPTNKKDNKCY